MIKKNKYLLIFLAVILIFVFRDYNWHKIAYKQANQAEWTKLKEKEDFSLLRIWTWFYPPKGKIFYYDNNYGMFDSLIILPVLYYELDFPAFTRKQGFYCFDCSKNTQSYVEKEEDLQSTIKNRNEWFNYKDLSSYPIEYFCSQYTRYFSIDIFGYEFEINPYLLSGDYKIPEVSKSGFVRELVNLNPYNISSEDSAYITGSIKKWLQKNITDKDIKYVKIKNITYEATDLSQGHPVDLFKIEFNHLNDNYFLVGTFYKLWNFQSDSKDFFFLPQTE